MNANSPNFGDNNRNTKGKQLEIINRTGKMNHQGPPFHTFEGRKRLTTPDKITTNKKFLFNLHMQQGPQTSSDHLPIIVQISTNPIQIPIKPRYSFKKAKWDEFQRELNTFKQDDLQNKTKKQKLRNYMKPQIKLKDTTINHRVLPHFRNTPTIIRLIADLDNTQFFL